MIKYLIIFCLIINSGLVFAARDFNGSSDLIDISTNPSPSAPFTVSAWITADDFSAGRCIISLSDSSLGTDQHALLVSDNGGGPAGNDLSAMSRNSSDSGAFHSATSTLGLTAATWHHVAGVWVSTSSRKAYVDGGNEGTDATSVNAPALDNTDIGRLGDSSPNWNWSGAISEVAIWDVALSTAEIASLGDGCSPLFIRPQSLIYYSPLIRELTDNVGGSSLTATGTTVVAHSRVYNHSAPHIITAPSAPGGETTQVIIIANNLNRFINTHMLFLYN